MIAFQISDSLETKDARMIESRPDLFLSLEAGTKERPARIEYFVQSEYFRGNLQTLRLVLRTEKSRCLGPTSVPVLIRRP